MWLTGKLRERTRGKRSRLPPWQTREVRMWHYPTEHVEKLTARCAEKLKQLRSERAEKRAEKRAAKKRIEHAARLMKAWRANPRWDRASRSND
jgi:hypothetical protein